MRHFLTLRDYNKEEFEKILSFGKECKASPEKFSSSLKNKSVGLLFQKPSTRTRLSFEVGVSKLGGSPVFLSEKDLQLKRGEPIKDTIRVFNGYLDMLMVRTFGQSILDEMVEYATIPIINGLTNEYHPCQALADFLTIREHFGWNSRSEIITYIGDGNNVAVSLMWASVLSGNPFRIASPSGYEMPKQEIIEAKKTGGQIEIFTDLKSAIQGSSVIYTDVWASMGQEEERAKRLKDFSGWTVNSKILENAAENHIVLHCLPAHREEEISESIMEKHADTIFRQAENRMHAQNALMHWLEINT